MFPQFSGVEATISVLVDMFPKLIQKIRFGRELLSLFVCGILFLLGIPFFFNVSLSSRLPEIFTSFSRVASIYLNSTTTTQLVESPYCGWLCLNRSQLDGFMELIVSMTTSNRCLVTVLIVTLNIATDILSLE